MSRFLRFVFTTAAVVLMLTACTAKWNGATAITVDVGGNLVATFFWCTDNPPDGAILEEVGSSGGPIARYHAPRLTGNSSSLRINQPTGGWTLEGDPPTLRPGARYRIYGWTSDDSSSFGGVEFTPEHARLLASGHVLVQRYDMEHDTYVDVLLTQSEFQAEARKRCTDD